MTLAFRLFRGAVGLVAPPSASLLSTQQGMFGTISEPGVWEYNGKDYLAWTDDAGRVWAAEYVISTGLLSTPVNVGTMTVAVDGIIHDTPSILVRSSDHKIMVFANVNGSGVPRYWLSTSAEDATAFGSAVTFGSSATFTYISPVQLTGVSGSPIYAFVKYWTGGTGNLAYFKSTDGGSSWSGPTTIMTPASTSTFYWQIATDGNARADIFATTTDRVASSASVYHFKFASDTLYKSDGTSLGAGPVASNAGTLVQNTSLGSARANGWAYSGGNPCALIMCDTGSDNLARVAVWSGSAWTVQSVGYQGGYAGGVRFLGGAGIPHDDPYTVWMPQKVGSTYEMYRLRSIDSGATWTAQPVTEASAHDNYSPTMPMNRSSGLNLAWVRGVYTSDSNYDFDIWAA